MPGEQKSARRPREPHRIAVAMVVALVAAAPLCRPWDPSFEVTRPSDFYQLWVGARAWALGQSPYEVIARSGWGFPLYYPMPAVLAAAPFAPLPFWLARALFAAVSAGMLAYALTTVAWWPLLACATGGFPIAILAGQWSPLFTAAALLPSMGPLFAVKPTIGAALWCYRPTRRALLGAAVLLLLTLAAYPPWPHEWLAAVRHAPLVRAPVTRPGGIVLLLAFLRWRRPEARLLVALALVPQTISIQETVPLFLGVRSRAEALAFAALTLPLAVLGAVLLRTPPMPLAAHLERTWPPLFLLVYLPALVAVLRRPNVAEWPPWLGTRGRGT